MGDYCDVDIEAKMKNIGTKNNLDVEIFNVKKSGEGEEFLVEEEEELLYMNEAGEGIWEGSNREGNELELDFGIDDDGDNGNDDGDDDDDEKDEEDD